jgi:hypothetical protein
MTFVTRYADTFRRVTARASTGAACYALRALRGLPNACACVREVGQGRAMFSLLEWRVTA